MPSLQAVAAAAPANERISWRARGDIGGGVQRGCSELGAAASTKAVWWGLRLASLLTHLSYYNLLRVLSYLGKSNDDDDDE